MGVGEAAGVEDSVTADVVGGGVKLVVAITEELSGDDVNDGTEMPSTVLVASPAVVPL